jgi:hypothetical protein
MSASEKETPRLVAAKRIPRLAAALALCTLCVAARASAQTPSPRPAATPAATPSTVASPSPTPADAQPASPAPAREVSEDEADLTITARVTARELRFDAVPNPSVEFPGRPERVTSWEAERTNLPRPVQPGVTYRDIGVRLRIVSVFADIDRIVAEALGETPPTDDAPRPAPTPPNDAQASTVNTTSTTDAMSTTDATSAAETASAGDAGHTGREASASPVRARASRAEPPRRAGGRRARRLR